MYALVSHDKRHLLHEKRDLLALANLGLVSGDLRHSSTSSASLAATSSALPCRLSPSRVAHSTSSSRLTVSLSSSITWSSSVSSTTPQPLVSFTLFQLLKLIQLFRLCSMGTWVFRHLSNERCQRRTTFCAPSITSRRRLSLSTQLYF